MGNPHYAAWFGNEIMPISACGNVHYNTEHLGDAVEAMLGLCFIMEAVLMYLREDKVKSCAESDFGIHFSTDIFGDWLCEQLRAYHVPLAKDALAATKATQQC